MRKTGIFSQEGVTGVEQIKNWISDHYVVCGSAIIFIGCIIGGWLYYTASRTANDYHNANQSVERVEAGIDSAGKRLDSAQNQIEYAQRELDRADKTTGRIKQTAGTNQTIIDECTEITDRMQERAGNIQAIIRDIESTNQTTGTQTDSHT